MSGYRTHLLAYSASAVASSLAAERLFPGFLAWDAFPTAFALGAVWSLLPDLDTPSSKLGMAAGLASAAAVLIVYPHYLASGEASALAAAAGALAILCLLWLGGHRGILHTPAAGLVLCVPLLAAGPLPALMGLAGYMSHLALDGRLFH
jgi:hypothetical protein